MRDAVSADVTRLADTRVRHLASFFEFLAPRVADPEEGAVLAALAESCRTVVSHRVLVEQRLIADPAFPPSWAVAVASLPLLDDDAP
jgi:hypothetical protein